MENVKINHVGIKLRVFGVIRKARMEINMNIY